MKKTVLRYGGYSALAELILFIALWLFIYITNVGHKVQGYISYVNIICPLLFVYFGIRYYRDQVKDGYISFMNAVGVGILIVVLPAVAFGIIETVYVLYIDPAFYDKIAAYDIEQYRKVLSPSAFAIKLQQIHQQIMLEKNPLYNFMAMFFTIGSVGVIITVISSAKLTRRLKAF